MPKLNPDIDSICAARRVQRAGWGLGQRSDAHERADTIQEIVSALYETPMAAEALSETVDELYLDRPEFQRLASQGKAQEIGQLAIRFVEQALTALAERELARWESGQEAAA